MTVSVKTLMKKKNDLLAELREHGEKALKVEFKAFFKDNPDCLALKWRQYTPYFNDGEPCEFSRNDIEVKLKTAPEDAEGDYGDEGFESLYCGNKSAEVRAVTGAVRELEAIDDEIYQIAFGDHVTVTATREGFEVEEYSHD